MGGQVSGSRNLLTVLDSQGKSHLLKSSNPEDPNSYISLDILRRVSRLTSVQNGMLAFRSENSDYGLDPRIPPIANVSDVSTLLRNQNIYPTNLDSEPDSHGSIFESRLE